MDDNKDWRLAVQHDYLRGVVLARRAYRQYSGNPNWDHDHCAFCQEKFQVPSAAESVQTAYCTLDEYHWVCERCFADFRDMFGWKLSSERGNAV